EPRTLFVDDLHEIKGTVAERTLERFLELRPPWVRVVLGSRSAPLFNLPRLRVSGTIREVSGEDLRFRSWEVEHLLRDNGIPLPPEVVAALTRKVAGWAAGLQFFQLATAQMSAAARCQAVTALDGRSAIIKSYLARNVVEDLGDELYHFLTR